ncbi:MAG: S-methyl-5'-thioadenosine phosphorylase [Anaerolineales bacterium]
MPDAISLGIIGGSGLYSLEGFEERQELDVQTPFGEPSAPVVVGLLEKRRVAFIARHGIGHRLTPSEVPYRANIYALKSLGVERVLSVSACGSLREDCMPGQIVVPDQLVDNTRGRARSFFGRGLVAHLSVPNPFCSDLSRQLAEAVRVAGGVVHVGGTFVTIEGPRFSTKAESELFRSWGMSIVGMTAAPEAFLAREAEMCYGTMAHVTDYDVWHMSEAPVTVDAVVRTLRSNTVLAQEAIRVLVRQLADERPCDCSSSMAGAFITQMDVVPKALIADLGPLVSKYIPN